MTRGSSAVWIGVGVTLLASCGAGDVEPTAADDPAWGEPAPSPTDPPAPELLRHSAGVVLTVPTGWQVDPGEGPLRMAPPDGSLLARFTVLDTADLDRALAAIDERLDRRLAAHDLGSDRATVVGGLQARLASGSGQVKGEPVKLRIALVLTPRGQVLALVAMVRRDAPAHRLGELSDLVTSIRAATLKER